MGDRKNKSKKGTALSVFQKQVNKVVKEAQETSQEIFGRKRSVGKPRIFETPEILLNFFKQFKFNCFLEKKPITKIGFCLYMDISREALLLYTKRDEYHDVMEYIDTACEADLVQNALTGKYAQPTSIFLLKNNHGYKDESRINLDVKKLQDEINNMPKEQLLKEAEAAIKRLKDENEGISATN